MLVSLALLLLIALGILIIGFAKPLARYAVKMLPQTSTDLLEGFFIIGYRIGGVILFLLAVLMFLNFMGIFKLH